MIEDNVKRGWALKYNGLFWSEYPSYDAHFNGDCRYGDDVKYIKVSTDVEKPPTKTWFTYPNSPYVEKMRLGEWVFVEIRTSMIEV